MEKTNLTHALEQSSFDETIQTLKDKIISRGDLPHVSVARQLDIIDQFCAFPLGRFILERRGANGFWTDYMISHPHKGRVTGLNIEGKPFTPLEEFFLNKIPIIVAHQERFGIFQKLAQSFLTDGAVLASIPCGIMRDLLTLDFSNVTNFELVGIDIDHESLLLAKQYADEKGITNIRLIEQDAWQMPFINEFDVITSSGLNVYESDPQRLLELYRRFFQALKPGGKLIISVLTYPPDGDKKSDWDLTGIEPETLLLDRIIHKDILDIKWRNFRSAQELDKEFILAGFIDIKVHFDKHRIFPTIVATKPF